MADNTRIIVLGIDDIARLFKDYAGEAAGIPEDAQCDTLLFNRQEKRMCLRLSSESWAGPQPPENIRFDLQRTFMVGKH